MSLQVGSRARHVATGKVGTIGAVSQTPDGPRYRLDHKDEDGEHETWGEETRFDVVADGSGASQGPDAMSTDGPPGRPDSAL